MAPPGPCAGLFWGPTDSDSVRNETLQLFYVISNLFLPWLQRRFNMTCTSSHTVNRCQAGLSSLAGCPPACPCQARGAGAPQHRVPPVAQAQANNADAFAGLLQRQGRGGDLEKTFLWGISHTDHANRLPGPNGCEGAFRRLSWTTGEGSTELQLK